MNKNRQKTAKSIYFDKEKHNMITALQVEMGLSNYSDTVNFLVDVAHEKLGHINVFKDEVIELKNEIKDLKKDREITLTLIKKQMALMEKLEQKYSNHKEDLEYKIDRLSKENDKLLQTIKPINLYLFEQEMQ